MTQKKRILRLLLKNPLMPLKDVAVSAQASYSYVWQIAKAYGLLRDRDRAQAASVAAPFIEYSGLPNAVGVPGTEQYSSSHHPSHAPLPCEVDIREAYYFPVDTTLYASTDHGMYYKFPLSADAPYRNKRLGILELYDPDGPKSEVPLFGESYGYDYGYEREITVETLEEGNEDYVDRELNVPKTLFYTNPHCWEEFSVGDLRRCLDNSVTAHKKNPSDIIDTSTKKHNPPTYDMVLIERQPDLSSRIVTTDGRFMRWEKGGRFPFLDGQEKVFTNYYDLRDMVNMYHYLYSYKEGEKAENEPVMISHGSPASGVRVSAGQVCLRSPEPHQAEAFPSYEDIMPKASETKPYVKVHKDSLCSALKAAIYADTESKSFVLRLDSQEVDLNNTKNVPPRERQWQTFSGGKFRVANYGTNPPRAIGLPDGKKAVQQFESILRQIPTDHVIISGCKDRRLKNHKHNIVLLSEDNRVPDISNPDSSGVAFRATKARI